MMKQVRHGGSPYSRTHRKVSAGIIAALTGGALAASATAGGPVLSGSYSWEDGFGTVLGSSGNLINPTNVTHPEPVNFGDRALRVTEAPHSGTPQAWVAFIENLEHGDVIEAKVYGYDDVFGGNPQMRIWAHYAISGDVFSNAGSAGGNNTPTLGFGWEEISHTWTFDSAGGTRDALVIEVRLYSDPPDCPKCSTDFYIDDVTVNVICAGNPNVSITFPDWTPITGAGKPGPNCVPPKPCDKPSHTGAYGWEDGDGTIFGSSGNLIGATNISGAEGPVYEGERGLRLVQGSPSGTPQAWVAYIQNLEDGDVIRAGFQGYTDDEAPGNPRVRIWAHYGISGDHNVVVGQAGGSETYSVPGQWSALENEWTFDSNFGQRNALMIQVRLYSTEQGAEFFVDDVWVEVCSNNPGVSITFPDSVDSPEPTNPCDPELGTPDLSGAFGWEDGESTILGSFGNVFDPVNVMAPEPVFDGTHALRVSEAPHGGTPQAYVAFIENLSHGDVIVGRFHGFDDTPGASPSMRIWGHYAHSGDVMSFAGSASGNETFTSGVGWEELCHTWVFDVGNPPRDALVIEVRLFSTPPDCEECSTDFYIDDVSVDVYSSNPDVTITFPDGNVIGHPTEKCPADFDNSGSVDVIDLLTLLAAWGTSDPQIDLNDDGNVDVQDLLILLGAWGPCP